MSFGGWMAAWLLAAGAPQSGATPLPDTKGTPAPGSDAAATELVNAAGLAMKLGDTTTASDNLDKALGDFATLYAGEKRRIYCGMTMPETLLYMGMAAKQKTDAVAIAPGWCMALFLKGYLAVDAGHLDEARSLYNRALAMAPMHWQFLGELGFTYRNSDPAKSLDLYKQAEPLISFIDKKDQAFATAKVRHGQGYALSELKRFDEAEAIYRACLKDDPDDKVAKDELTYIAQHRGK